jgi:hypothetical protein
MRKGRHTKRNVWDDTADLEVWRGGEKLDPGVNYFVLMLDQMGLRTTFSCEGHPDGFYIMFYAPYNEAVELRAAGYFTVGVEGQDYWSIRRTFAEIQPESNPVDALRWAAQAWEARFGPLDFNTIELVLD